MEKFEITFPDKWKLSETRNFVIGIVAPDPGVPQVRLGIYDTASATYSWLNMASAWEMYPEIVKKEIATLFKERSVPEIVEFLNYFDENAKKLWADFQAFVNHVYQKKLSEI